MARELLAAEFDVAAAGLFAGFFFFIISAKVGRPLLALALLLALPQPELLLVPDALLASPSSPTLPSNSEDVEFFFFPLAFRLLPWFLEFRSLLCVR